MKEVFLDSWRLMAPYWRSEERKKAWGLLSGVIVTVITGIYFQVLLNEWSRVTFDAFQNYNTKLFISQWKLFALYLIGFLLVFMLQVYFKNKLIIAWRRWMTNSLLSKWLEKKAYYKMSLYDCTSDNPDQRLSQDVGEFVTLTETVFINSIDKFLTLITFSVLLWSLSSTFSIPECIPVVGGKVIPGLLFWITISYSLLNTYISFRFGKTIVSLMFNKEKFEANFRYSLMRIRENTESIALYQGERAEKKASMSFYQSIIKNMYKTMYWNIRYFLWTSFILNISSQVPFLLAAPFYFSKKILFGGVIQIANAISHVQNSILHFMQILPTLADLRASNKRLVGFINDLECIQKKDLSTSHIKHIIKPQTNIVHAKLKSVLLPTDKVLVGNVDITFSQGESILLAGPSGSGKSTFLRVLSGIWPFGQGAVQMPDFKDILFVPQRPYIPLGTLRDILLYPSHSSQRARKKRQDNHLKELMIKVGLSDFIEELDKNCEWSKRLSLGEQQKISFCRILLHKPKWVFLDEATSSLDELAEKELYKLITQEIKGITIVSIAHRSTLKPFHHRCIYFNTTGMSTVLEDRPLV